MYKLFVALIIYIGVMVIITTAQPELMYDRAKKECKPFGTQDGDTLFPLWLCAITVAIASYVVAGIGAMAWTQHKTTIQPMGELTDDPTSASNEDPMVLTPMRHATFGGQQMPTFATQHHNYAPPQMPHATSHHAHATAAYPASSVGHSPHCAMHTRQASAYVHPSKQKMHVRNSRVWRDLM
jgi:hypothetical protein